MEDVLLATGIVNFHKVYKYLPFRGGCLQEMSSVGVEEIPFQRGFGSSARALLVRVPELRNW